MSDWDLVGGDPAPGDPGKVRRLGNEFATTHRDAEAAARELRRVVNNWEGAIWSGPAADRFKRQFTSRLPDELDQLHRSYDLASQALLRYADQLQNAQASAQQAKGGARSAEDARRNGQAEVDAANRQINDLSKNRDAMDRQLRDLYHRLQHLQADDPNRRPTETQYYNAQRSRQRTIDAINQTVNARNGSQRQVHDAESNLGAARRLADQARHLKHEAARRAAGELDRASHEGIQNKNFFQQAADFAVGIVTFDPDTWDQLTTALERISTQIAVVALVVALCVPGVNLAVLAVMALVVSVALLVCACVKVANDRGDWTDIGWAILDVAIAATGLKGGSVAKGLAKTLGKEGAKRASKSLARNSLKYALRHPGKYGKDLRNYFIRHSETMGVLKRACNWSDARHAKNLLHFAIAPKRGIEFIHATLKIIKRAHQNYEVYRDYSREWKRHGPSGAANHFVHHITDPRTLIKISRDLVGGKPTAAVRDAF